MNSVSTNFTEFDACSVNSNEIKYTLYNSKYSSGITPFSATDLIPGEPIFVLFHGWIEDSNKPWIISARSALLAKYSNSNVIVIDYGKYSMDPLYYFAWCSAENVGLAISTKFQSMEIPTNKITAIGFSLGAQIAGVWGRDVIEKGMAPLDTIIALEAAGIGYDDMKKIFIFFSHEYLKSGDALKVIGIYSDRKGLSMDTLYADVNVLLNDGMNQDCTFPFLCPLFHPLEEVKPCMFCAHIFARETFVEAIPMEPEYTARKCEDFNSYVSCSGNTKFVLQALVPDNIEKGLYYIKVNKEYQQVE